MVPYRGIAPVVTDLIGGHVALGIVDPPSAVAAIEGGKIKAIAMSSTARSPRLKDVPTFAEQGLPDFKSNGWFGIIAPAKTPPAVVEKLNAALVAELREPSVVERIRALGAEPMPQTPEEFSAFIVREIDKWTKVVAASGGLPK